MKVTIHQINKNGSNIAARCPHCGHFGTFLGVHAESTAITPNGQSYGIGAKMCPNDKCKGQIFFIKHLQSDELVRIYPTETIPFDKENIPDGVLAAFEEALKCHSENCFIASAIMIRKTLEEICHERGAKGKNLKDRLKELGSKIVMPHELLMGLDELRLLGNDAAHIEANTFASIGKEELDVSIDFAMEILKAVYQYESLLTKLRNLKANKLTGSKDGG